MRVFIAIWMGGLLVSCTTKNQPATLLSLGSFASQYVEARPVDVWLPPDYDQDEQYPVLYMHDGQMLFDSTTTWNGQEWGVDETMERLIAEGAISPTIVVAIHNVHPHRHSDYFPQKPFESLEQSVQDSLYQVERSPGETLFAGEVNADAYLRFIVEELKPYIDSAYATNPAREHTYIMGSSMGGLISWYALCEFPEVFGGAACLSTHWPGMFVAENNPIPEAFQAYLKKNLPPPSSHKFYFDYGTETLDALYEPFQLPVDSIMRTKGYNENLWMTRKFEGHLHDERSWSSRLHEPLTFLLKPKTK